jgi:uncharacterized protein (DUF1800 family)
MADQRAQIAHVLRRTTFGPHPGQVDAFADQFGDSGARGTVDALLDGPVELLPDAAVQGKRFDQYEELLAWWVDRLRQPATGVHEKLVWFWHGHLTSSRDKAGETLLWRQHHVLRRHALGSFRELMQAIAVDGAMLRFLDGDGSQGESPNENFAREVMELFCLGVGNYTEDDVKAAARAFSGWSVDGEDLVVSFDPERGYDRPVTFLGQRRQWDARSAIDAIVDHPACAPHVAGELWRFYAGTTPSAGVLDDLAKVFRDADLQIKPLVAAILRHDDFLASARSRARQPLEWLLPALAVWGSTDKVESWWCEQLGQVPFEPPNVAGWPLDDRWASAGQHLTRTGIVLDLEVGRSVIDGVPVDVGAVLEHCGVYDASESTRAAMARALAAQTEYDRGLELLLTLAVSSPEFALA